MQEPAEQCTFLVATIPAIVLRLVSTVSPSPSDCPCPPVKVMVTTRCHGATAPSPTEDRRRSLSGLQHSWLYHKRSRASLFDHPFLPFPPALAPSTRPSRLVTLRGAVRLQDLHSLHCEHRSAVLAVRFLLIQASTTFSGTLWKLENITSDPDEASSGLL